MNKEYAAVIDQEILRLNADTGYVWEHEDTGGGCDSYQVTVGKGYFMITYDASAPITADEWEQSTLGFYPNIDKYDQAAWYVEGTRADILAVFAEKVGQ